MRQQLRPFALARTYRQLSVCCNEVLNSINAFIFYVNYYNRSRTVCQYVILMFLHFGKALKVGHIEQSFEVFRENKVKFLLGQG